jgi:hypothetical protein
MEQDFGVRRQEHVAHGRLEGLARFSGWRVADRYVDSAIEHDAHAVVVVLGGNDTLRGAVR